MKHIKEVVKNELKGLTTVKTHPTKKSGIFAIPGLSAAAKLILAAGSALVYIPSKR